MGGGQAAQGEAGQGDAEDQAVGHPAAQPGAEPSIEHLGNDENKPQVGHEQGRRAAGKAGGGVQHREVGEARPAGTAGEKGGQEHHPQEGAAQSNATGPGKGVLGVRKLRAAGGVPHKEVYQQGEQHSGGRLPEKGGGKPQGLDGPGDQRRGKDGGDPAARCGHPQGEAPSSGEPAGDNQGEGDHPPVAIGQTGQDRPAAVGGEAVGEAEEEIRAHEAAHPQDHGVPQSQPAAQLVHSEHGQQGEQAPDRGDPGALGVGEAVDEEQVGLIDRKDVDAQTHHGKQGKPAAQADHPGPEAGASGRRMTGNFHRDPPNSCPKRTTERRQL